MLVHIICFYFFLNVDSLPLFFDFTYDAANAISPALVVALTAVEFFAEQQHQSYFFAAV